MKVGDKIQECAAKVAKVGDCFVIKSSSLMEDRWSEVQPVTQPNTLSTRNQRAASV